MLGRLEGPWLSHDVCRPSRRRSSPWSVSSSVKTPERFHSGRGSHTTARRRRPSTGLLTSWPTRVLVRGPFTFRIYEREATGEPALDPRLDMICLASVPECIPTDADARMGEALRAARRRE